MPEPKPPREAQILLADDSSVNRIVAIGQLQELGYQADSAADGVEVLTALQKKHYDIILMDCQMPRMDGFEVTRQIHKNHLHPPRIIAFTAFSMIGQREKCLESGMDDYLSKPFLIDELEAVLARWQPDPPDGGSEPSTRISTAPAEQRSAEPFAPEVIERLTSMKAVQTGSVFRELMEGFRKEAGQGITRITRAIENRLPSELQTAAHALNGACRNVGAQTMVPLCGKLEELGRAQSLEGSRELIGQLANEFVRVEAEIERIAPQNDTTTT